MLRLFNLCSLGWINLSVRPISWSLSKGYESVSGLHGFLCRYSSCWFWNLICGTAVFRLRIGSIGKAGRSSSCGIRRSQSNYVLLRANYFCSYRRSYLASDCDDYAVCNVGISCFFCRCGESAKAYLKAALSKLQSAIHCEMDLPPRQPFCLPLRSRHIL